MTVVDVMKQAAAPRNLVGLAVSAIIAGVPLTITQTAHAQEASESTECFRYVWPTSLAA